MLPDETVDQYEERIRAKRYNLLLKYMAVQLEENGQIKFTNLVRSNKRKMVNKFVCFLVIIELKLILLFPPSPQKKVAQKFYALLVLKKQMAVELYQNAEMPYSELVITKGQKYDEHMVSSVS